MNLKRSLAGLTIALACASPSLAQAPINTNAPPAAPRQPQPPTPAGSLRVGAAKIDITPTAGTTLEGRQFESVHDPLFARAIVFDSGSGPVAIISLDLIGADESLVVRQRIQRELGIALDHILVVPSHDHSAPRLADGAAGQGDYFKATNAKIVEAVRRAKASMQFARMGLGTGSADVNVNRDEYQPPRAWIPGFNPAGPSDKTVWVVKFETLTGEPIAVLFNYAVHSIVSFNLNVASGDLAGAAERIIERRYNNKAVAMFTMGPAGNQHPKYVGIGEVVGAGRSDERGTMEERRQMAWEAQDAQGFMLGSEVLRVARQIDAKTTSPRIGAAQSTFVCPVKPGKEGGPYKDGLPINLGMVLIDQIALGSVSGEVVHNINARLKAASPLTNTLMMTYTNGKSGYLTDDASYDTPNFEVNATSAARGCAENGIVGGLVGLITKLQ